MRRDIHEPIQLQPRQLKTTPTHTDNLHADTQSAMVLLEDCEEHRSIQSYLSQLLMVTYSENS